MQNRLKASSKEDEKINTITQKLIRLRLFRKIESLFPPKYLPEKKERIDYYFLSSLKQI